MTARVQENRTGTSNTPPANGSLPPGTLYVEMADPMRLWTGVPTTLDATGRRLMYDAAAQVASFNTRSGVVTLTNADVTTVLPPSSTTPAMDGTATIGTGTTWARSDHIHPTDTSRYAASNPNGYQTAAQVAAAVGPAVTTNVGRNLIHNPLFAVAQRGAGPFTASGYTVDRWAIAMVSDIANFAPQAVNDASRTQIGDETASTYVAGTVTGNAAAGALTVLYQPIESVRRLAGKTVTVSFWAIGTAGMKLGVSFDQNFGIGGSPSATVAGAGQSVTLTASFVRYSLTFALPSASGKTLGTAANDQTTLYFWYSSGATNATRAGNIGVQSGTINIWGVQLEIGSVATPLEKPDPRYDLSNCQRFYQLHTQIAVVGYADGGGGVITDFTLPVTMRGAPTVTFVNIATTNASGLVGNSFLPSHLRFLINALTTGTAQAYFDILVSADL